MQLIQVKAALLPISFPVANQIQCILLLHIVT